MDCQMPYPWVSDSERAQTSRWQLWVLAVAPAVVVSACAMKFDCSPQLCHRTVVLAAAAQAPGYARWRGLGMRGRICQRNLDRPGRSPGASAPMRADPCHDTGRLTDALAPSCHERPSGGLWRRVRPLDANLDDLGGLFRGYGTGGAKAPGRRGGFVRERGSRPRGGPESRPRNRAGGSARRVVDARARTKHAFVRCLRYRDSQRQGTPLAALTSVWSRWLPRCDADDRLGDGACDTLDDRPQAPITTRVRT
jgi:hypothetical protein